MVYSEEYHIRKRKGNTYLLMPGSKLHIILVILVLLLLTKKYNYAIFRIAY
jgi:hypothetical protein